MAKTGWGLALAAVLAGCAVGPDYRPPQTALPAHFAVPAQRLSEAEPKAEWWRAFGDETLDALMVRARRQNLDVQAAWARARQSRALAGAVGASAWPQLSVSADQSRDRMSLNGEQFANVPIANPQNQFTDTRGALSASWELDLFGLNARSLEEAVAQAGSAEAMAQATLLEVEAELARDYLDLRAAQARLKVAERNAALADDLLRLTRLQQRAGETGMLPVDQAATSARNAAAQLPPLQAQIRADLDGLALLLGNTPHALDGLSADGAALPEPQGVFGVGLPSDLLRRRPDVRRAERDLAAASADIGVATAAQYPNFSLVGSFGVDAVHQGQLTSQASRFWSAGPQLSLPLFSGGALSSRVKASREAYQAALADYRKTVLQALADSETALMQFDRDCARLDQLAQAREAAAQALALTRRREAAGEAATMDVLQMDSQLQQADDAWISARLARSEALVALFQSLGGGW